MSSNNRTQDDSGTRRFVTWKRMVASRQFWVITLVAAVAVLIVVLGAVSGVTATETSDGSTEISDEVYTNDSLRLIAGGAPVDESVVDREMNGTIRGPLVRTPQRPWTVEQAVRRSGVVDGYRSQLDEDVYIPVEDEWIPLEEMNPTRQWVVGVGSDPLQSTEHPDKSLTVEVEESGFTSDAPVRNANVRYNGSDGSYTVTNPIVAEVKNETGEWVSYNELTVVDQTFEGFAPINAATVEVDGQDMRIETDNSIGFMPIRNAQIVWDEASIVERLFGYDSGWSIANEEETEIYDGTYTTLELYHQNIVSYFDPAATDQSIVPQLGDSDRWAVGDGGEVTLQSGESHTVIRDHWAGLAHLDPGAKFEGEIDGESETFYIADPDGFRVYAPHDFRVVDPPENSDGTTKERWIREDVDRTVEVTNGEETVTGGPWFDLPGGEDGLEITSTVTVTYTHEWGEVGEDYEHSESVEVTTTQEKEYDLRSFVDDEVDVTVYVVDGEEHSQVWYEIDGDNSVDDAPVEEIAVNADSDMAHTLSLPWQFMPMLDYDGIETRTEESTSDQSVSLDPTAPPWSSTTDHVAGDEIESGIAYHQLQPDENTSTTTYDIDLGPTVASGNHSFAIPALFGGDASGLGGGTDLSTLEDADVEATTIYGTGKDGTGINSTSLEYIEYTQTDIQTAFHPDDGTLQILLEDEHGVPVPNRTLQIDGGEEETVVTDEDGRAEVEPVDATVTIVFGGDPVDMDAEWLFDQSATTVHDPDRVASGGDIFDYVAQAVGMLVFFAPILAFAVLLIIWRLWKGRSHS